MIFHVPMFKPFDWRLEVSFDWAHKQQGRGVDMQRCCAVALCLDE